VLLYRLRLFLRDAEFLGWGGDGCEAGQSMLWACRLG